MSHMSDLPNGHAVQKLQCQNCMWDIL